MKNLRHRKMTSLATAGHTSRFIDSDCLPETCAIKTIQTHVITVSVVLQRTTTMPLIQNVRYLNLSMANVSYEYIQGKENVHLTHLSFNEHSIGRKCCKIFFIVHVYDSPALCTITKHKKTKYAHTSPATVNLANSIDNVLYRRNQLDN